MQNARVLLAGGGTGGHVFPLIPVIRELKKRGAKVAFIGPEEFPLSVLKEEGIAVHVIVRAGKLRRYWSFENVTDALKLPVALFQSVAVIRSFKPTVTLGKGGYGSIAPVVASWVLRVPVVLHESDAIPGLANRFLERFAQKILVGFHEAEKHFKKPAIHTGNPVRTAYLNLRKSEARKVLGLDTQRKVIFALGGSQGALSINKLIREASQLLLRRYALIAACGENNEQMFKDINVNNAVVRGFFNEQELYSAYALSDVIVSRASAGVLFEIAASGKPSVLIPLPLSGSNHQQINARIYEGEEAAVVLKEEKTTPQTLSYAIESILSNPAIYSHMSSRARTFATLDAAEKIAKILLQEAKKLQAISHKL